MMNRSLIWGLSAALAATATFGCAGTTAPTTPTQAAAVQTAERHVASVSDKATLKAMVSRLPKHLTDAQAKTMLITIDPSRVRLDGKQARVAWAPGGLGLYGGGWGSGLYGGYGLGGGCGLGCGGLGYGGYGLGAGFYGGFGNYATFRYLQMGSLLFPYSYAGGLWSPYTLGGYFNVFDAALGWYYPFNFPGNWCC